MLGRLNWFSKVSRNIIENLFCQIFKEPIVTFFGQRDPAKLILIIITIEVRTDATIITIEEVVQKLSGFVVGWICNAEKNQPGILRNKTPLQLIIIISVSNWYLQKKMFWPFCFLYFFFCEMYFCPLSIIVQHQVPDIKFVQFKTSQTGLGQQANGTASQKGVQAET